MFAHIEAGRATGRDRASDDVLCRNVSEVHQNPVLFNQAAFVARRFAVSDALARAVAELAFSKGHHR